VKGRVAVIGGGIAGATAALRLAQRGHEVVLTERSDHLGGLVVSFEVAGTPLECFYHHVFPHEKHVIALIDELGLLEKLDWRPSSVGILTGGTLWPFTSPGDLLRFAPLKPLDRIRAGVGALRMSRSRDWRALDGVAALDWLAGLTGERAAEVIWEPLLRAKFGPASADVPAAWIWGRLRQRAGGRRRGGERLGYLRGGFRQLFDALHKSLVDHGVDVRTSAPVGHILTSDSRAMGIEVNGVEIESNAVVFTGALPGLTRLVPAELADPRWSAIGGLGVLCVVLEMRKQVSPIYWSNVCDSHLPFGGVIEHTNFVPAADYGGRHVSYVSRYFTAEEAVANADPDDEAARWVDALDERFPGFDKRDVIAVHPFRTPYAAPLVTVGHLGRIPPLRSDVDGLYVCTTAQIYPQDRGMSEGVRMGGEAADAVDHDHAAVAGRR
jgi:protoporphyrinogen oxidase